MNKKNIFWVIISILFAPYAGAMEKIPSRFEALRSEKIKAEEALNKVKEKESNARRSQDLLIKKADRVEEQIKEEEKKSGKSSDSIKRLEKQKESSIQKAEEWGSQIPGFESEIRTKEAAVKKIDAELVSLQQEALQLGYLLDPLSGTVSKNWSIFEQSLQEKLKSNESGKSVVLTTEAQNFIDKNAYHYQDQQNALQIILKLAGQADENLFVLYKQRLEQINTLLKNPQTSFINDLDKTLLLYQKIPQDQIAIIKQQFTAEWQPKLQKLKESFNESELQVLLNKVEQAHALMKNRGLGLADRFDENILKEMQDALEILRSERMAKNPENQEQGIIANVVTKAGSFAQAVLPETVFEGTKEAIEVTKALLVTTAVGFSQEVATLAVQAPGAMVEGMRQVAGQLEAYGKEANRIGEALQATPHNLEMTAQTFKATNELLEPIKKNVRWVPVVGPLLEQRIKSSQELMTLFNENQMIGQKTAAAGGVVAQSLAQLATKAGNMLNQALDMLPQASQKEKVVIADDFVKARMFIEEEKVGFNKPNPGRFAAAMKPVINFGKKIATYIREFLDTSQSRLQLAQKNYQTARTNYLKLLEFTDEQIAENPQENEITKKLQEKIAQANKDSNLHKNIEFASQQMVRAADEIASVYRDVQVKLNGAATSMEFIVKAYGQVVIEKQPKGVVTFINQVSDLRDQRVAYLQAAQEGVNNLETMLKDYDDFAENTQKTIEYMSAMISGQLVDTIQQYNLFIDATDKKLKDSINFFAYNQQDSNEAY